VRLRLQQKVFEIQIRLARAHRIDHDVIVMQRAGEIDPIHTVADAVACGEGATQVDASRLGRLSVRWHIHRSP